MGDRVMHTAIKNRIGYSYPVVSTLKDEEPQTAISALTRLNSTQRIALASIGTVAIDCTTIQCRKHAQRNLGMSIFLFDAAIAVVVIGVENNRNHLRAIRANGDKSRHGSFLLS